MTSVAVVAMPTAAPAPASSHAAANGDAFEAEFRAASAVTGRGQRHRSRDDAARTDAHDAPSTKAADAASGASAANDTATDRASTDRATDQAGNDGTSKDSVGKDNAADADAATTSDAEATATDAAAALPTAVALAVAQAPAPSTDSAGPGDASSGEAPQAPVVTSATQAAASIEGTGSPASSVVGVGAASADGATQASAPATAATASSDAVPATTAAAAGPQAGEASASRQDTAGSGQREGGAGGTNAGGGAVGTADPSVATAAQVGPDTAPRTEQASASGDRTSGQIQGAQAAQQAGAMTPVQAQTPTQGAATVAPNVPTFPTPLASQLTGQLTTLKQLPQGDHVLTLMVNPESFGPVKVVAHIGREGVSLEIFGASDAARAALRAALPDLRRDLAGAGLEPKLELGNGSGGQGASTDQSGLGHQSSEDRRAPRATFGVGALASTSAAPITQRTTHSGGIDLDL